MLDVGSSSAAKKPRKPEVVWPFFRRNADDRHTQVAADDPGDVAERHAFVGHTVQPCSRRSVFESEPVEVRRVERMNCRPPVGAVADVGSHPFFAGSADQTMGETVVIQVAVHQRRQPDNR